MQRPLTGIRVIGTDQYIAGPYCTMLLADAGAEVIKIERPGAGDPRRAMPPFAERDGKRRAGGFMAYNRNKKSLALDLRSGQGKAVFKRLAAKSDVLVDNLRPGSLERQGLGYEDLKAVNPGLVYAVISGFGRMPGRRGPYADRPAFDIVAEAMSGIMHMVGFEDKPPSWTIYGLADIYSGLVAAYGIMQALFMRERTGEGQFVDSAMYDNMLSLNESMIALHSVAGQSPHRGRPRNAYPRSAYRTRDGYIALNVPDERIWERLASTMGHPELVQDERTRNAAARIANREYLDPLIEDWLEDLTRDEAVERLNAAGVPAGSVYTVEDIFACPQVAARNLLMPINDPEVGEHCFARTPPMLSSSPELPANPAPRLGEHTREVLEDLLGYGADEVKALSLAGVIQVAS
ncbi:MAG TPA: CoA transferase [Gammaproteobacteria bacterium]|nr:CoA transferase [Gammaproteobacteria bacterium]